MVSDLTGPDPGRGLLSYLARFGNELFLHRNAWEAYFDTWIIFNPGPWSKSHYSYSMGRVQLCLLYTRSEYQGPSEELANRDWDIRMGMGKSREWTVYRFALDDRELNRYTQPGIVANFARLRGRQ